MRLIFQRAVSNPKVTGIKTGSTDYAHPTFRFRLNTIAFRF